MAEHRGTVITCIRSLSGLDRDSHYVVEVDTSSPGAAPCWGVLPVAAEADEETVDVVPKLFNH